MSRHSIKRTPITARSALMVLTFEAIAWALGYQDEAASGERSNVNKLISR